MSTRYAVAPAAPGAMGQDIPPDELFRYVQELGRWRDRRRAELDELDEAALRSDDDASLTADIVLSMTLWQAISHRYEMLVRAWDSGRVGETERRRLSTLIWGRLETGRDAQGGALSVSLPEACRLSDTLAGSLRSALRLGGTDPAEANRVHALRESVERVRDQVHLVPEANRGSAQGVLIDLDRRVVDVMQRFSRGADVGGLLGPLEAELATAERDLIVASAVRTQARDDHARAVTLRDELIARAKGVRELAASAQAAVRPVPRLGIPDPAALGEIPTEPAALSAYLTRLDRVGQALDQAQSAYGSALDRNQEAVGTARAHAAQAEAFTDVPGAAGDIAALVACVDEAEAARPADTDRLAALADALASYTARLRERGER